MEFDTYYKDFIKFKLTHFNLFQKIHSWEDLRYTLGLVWFALTKIMCKHFINNETVRGR